MKLNLFSKYNPKIVEINNVKKVLCLVRKSYINYTSEEKVRQAFIYFLINEIKVPIDKIVLEKRVKLLDGNLGRIDILVYDELNKPYIIYECKKENEYLTEEVAKQALNYFFNDDYFYSLNYLGYLIGEELIFYRFGNINEYDELEQFELTSHPNYINLQTGKYFEYYTLEENKFERLNYKEPYDNEILEQFYDYGTFGKKTDQLFYPFMINFYNWMYDVDDKLVSDDIEDIGLKFTKYGNANNSFPAYDYRTFIINHNNDKQFFSLAFISVSYSSKEEFGTCLMVGVENRKTKHSSLQLNIEKSIALENDYYEIWHDGNITIGKTGAAKRTDLINYVFERNPDLIKNDQVYLGKFHKNKPIKSNNQETKDFLNKIFSYCLLRDEFREMRKEISRNKI
jgi:hypothetical protein